MLYAKKGEIVTCENGHAICELADDIRVGDAFRGSIFVNWRGMPEPRIGDPIPRCPECGREFMAGTAGLTPLTLCVGGGWRAKDAADIPPDKKHSPLP